MPGQNSSQIDEFLRSLKSALVNASVYFSNHPIFLRSLEDLQKKIAVLVGPAGKISLLFSPEEISLNDQPLEMNRFNRETADFFHRRKVLRLDINSAVGKEELSGFLALMASRSPSQVQAATESFAVAMAKVGIKNIVVQDLDYGSVLKAQDGTGLNRETDWDDIVAAINGGATDISGFADDLLAMIPDLKMTELVKNEKLIASISKFIEHMKQKRDPRFAACLDKLLLVSTAGLKAIGSQDMDNVKKLFETVDIEDISAVIVDRLLGEAGDQLRFDDVSRVVGPQRSKDLAQAIAAGANSLYGGQAGLDQRLKDLFMVSSDPVIIEVYRDLLLKSSGSGSCAGHGLDWVTLSANYRYILLNLLVVQDTVDTTPIWEKLLVACEEAIKEKDWAYAAVVKEALRVVQAGGWEPGFSHSLTRRINELAEESALGGDPSDCLALLVSDINMASRPWPEYADAVFVRNLATPAFLRLFFKFIPQKKDDFLERLKPRKDDIRFLVTMMQGLKSLPGEVSAPLYCQVYGFCGNFIKVEILRLLKGCGEPADKLFEEAAASGDAFLKREVLQLADSPSVRENLAKIMFAASDRQVLLENITISRENRFLEARPYLEALSHRKFFWNSIVRQAAQQALEKI